jgi:tRNA A-37 threonylcarbamoyl transferase component Bud32
MVLAASDAIHIAEKGFSFPMAKSLALHLRLSRLWSEVQSAKVISAMGASDAPIKKHGSSLRLIFKTGGKVDLPLANFNRESLATFVSALQEWATDGDVDREQLEHVPRLWDYEEGELAGLRQISYTKFWEEELANNYSFTSYVPLQIGQKVNESLIVEKQIAAGGFSAIYLVKNAQAEKFVLKESVVPASADEKTREKAKEHFKREAELLIKLSHPLIAKVFDHFVHDGRDYLVLEYIVGPDARELIRSQGPQPVSKVVHWGQQIASVLSYLHAQTPAVVHRDLSADNIVIDAKNNAVLIDFGAANEFVGEATGTLVGKQAYMSPEQIKGKVTPQSDIYSFGATVYFLLTGKDPEPLASCQPSRAGVVVPEKLDLLVSRCTKLDTNERIASADDLVRALNEIADQLTLVASSSASEKN